MFILFSVYGGLEFWSINHTSIYQNSESKFFKNIKDLDEIFNKGPNDLLGKNVHKTLNLVDNHC